MEGTLDREAMLREPWAEHADKERLRHVSEKQFRYVRNYLSSAVGGTKRAAAREAGYSPKALDSAVRFNTAGRPGDIIADYRSELLFDVKQEKMKHLAKLAELRDIAVDMGKIGPAITAETNRGKVFGLYNIKDEDEQTKAKIDVSIAMAKLQNILDRSAPGSGAHNIVAGLLTTLQNKGQGGMVTIDADYDPMPSHD